MNNKRQQKQKSNQQGFTLIELMVVVAIIGILVTISFLAYKAYVEKTELTIIAYEVQTHRKRYELLLTTEGRPSSDSSYDGSQIGLDSSSDTTNICKLRIVVGTGNNHDALLCIITKGYFKSGRVVSNRIYRPGGVDYWNCQFGGLSSKARERIKSILTCQ